jgi:hypothetical protein
VTASPALPGNGTVDDPVPPPLDGAGPAEDAPSAQASPAAESAQQAEARATAFMRAFARTDLEQARWWSGIQGYFTPSAATIYRYTLVENVPVTSVVDGSAQLRPGSTKYLAQVEVDTDAGIYTVEMVRTLQDWLVERARPPQ